jgi:hypothetical protein
MVKLTEKKKCEEDTPIAKSPVLACGELRVWWTAHEGSCSFSCFLYCIICCFAVSNCYPHALGLQNQGISSTYGGCSKMTKHRLF